MTPEKFRLQLEANFSFEPTESQQLWFPAISDFIFSEKPRSAFLLKGYAGTGKTTLISSLVKDLPKTGFKVVLMAPTGRAAKVMATYSKTSAKTIHKQIYYPKAEKSGKMSFQLKPNKYKKTLFVIDEASMIGDDRQNAKLFENGSLLHDVVQYVSGGEKCKLLFVGDQAQLPPVHLDLSPALDEEELKQFHFDEVFSIELEGVVRQKKDSGILKNATQLRVDLDQGVYDQFKFEVQGVTDIQYTNNGMDVFEAIESAFSEAGVDQTVFIVRSNKRANSYNENIRRRILGLEDELSVGDQLMVVKNNYFWLEPESAPGFIANGDVVKILSIHSRKELYGFSFAEVSVQLVDYPNEKPFDAVLLLDTLQAESASLSFEEGNRLYQAVLEDYASERSKYKKFLKVKNNRFFNALQVKYSYAITCHKSQGGQWKHVFIEKPYLPEGPNKDYLRWLYTAMTRATKKLYLLGFPNDDFVNID
ncbi:AAA family ATPase [Flavobacteriaceae bacterium]|nr:AAA family ATPase [Flavobacteriaceae bacterium]MDA9015157.1 AAA family ATPase [Flavobacteriaceae bacterium]MDC3354720.1 AAA family ATPase [Flavobacteriaceae bacterium]